MKNRVVIALALLLVFPLYAEAVDGDEILDAVESSVKTVETVAGEVSGAAQKVNELFGDDSNPLPDDEFLAIPGLVAAFSVSQSYSDNWTGGSNDSFAWKTIIDTWVLFDSKWPVDLKATLKYGQVASGGETRKDTDDLRALIKVSYKALLWLYPYVAAHIATQVSPGYEYTPEKIQVSGFMDPGYITQSIGVDFKPPVDFFKSRIGAAMRQTITDDYTAIYSGEGADKIRNEAGLEWVNEFNFRLAETIVFKSTVDFFSNLTSLDATDINSDTTLVASVNEWLNFSINVLLKYDRDISSRSQLKQSLSAGLTFKII